MTTHTTTKTTPAGGHQQASETRTTAHNHNKSVAQLASLDKVRALQERGQGRPALSPDHDLIEVQRTLAVLLDAGQLTELRVLGAVERTYPRPHTISGYFDDPEALLAALPAIEEAEGIYLVPNPIKPELLARVTAGMQVDSAPA